MIKFTIIIPTYNRARFLEVNLRNLITIDYPKSNFEVIVADNNSTDRTRAVVAKLRQSFPNLKLKYTLVKRPGHTFACNSAAEKARSSYLLFIDDDIEYQSNILHLYASTFKKHPDAYIVGGKIKAVMNKGFIQVRQLLRPEEMWILGECDLGNKRKVLKYPETILSGCFCIKLNSKPRRKIFSDKLGRKVGSVTLYGQDYELCLRALLENKVVIYEPKIEVKNHIDSDRNSLIYILKRQFFAGVERRIIDRLLFNYVSHRLFKIDYLNICKKIFFPWRMRSIYFQLIGDSFYSFGYIYERVFHKHWASD